MPGRMTQRFTLACQLCPEDAIFQLDETDPDQMQHTQTINAMFDHLVEVHGENRTQVETMRMMPVMFGDGANGYAIQTKNWFIPDETGKTGRVLVGFKWEQERVKPGKKRR
jgi:hypothetical protein